MKNKNEDVSLKKKEYLIDDPHFEQLKKDVKDMEKVISDAVPDISKMLEPVQEQFRNLSVNIPSIKASLFTGEQQKMFASANKGIGGWLGVSNMPKRASLFTEEQQKMFASANKGIGGWLGVSNMPKRASFFTEEQLEIFKSASKGISFKIPNLPKTISFFTPAQQEVLKSVGKGLNLGIDRLPKTASIFTTEQQQILKSTGELLSLKINNMPKTAYYFNPAQRSMLKSIAAGLNISNYTKVAPSITVDDFIPYWEDEEVQETIRQEIYDLEGIESEKSLKDRFNNWARTLIDLRSTFLERAPAAYLLLLLLVWVAGLTVKPTVEDLIKEKVWHQSDYLEDTKEEPIRKQTKAFKTSIIMDQEVSAEISYADAERSMRHVRITNRETSVFRSEQRSSGRIDTIQSNKPVIILHKKKNWSLVLYQDNHNQEVEGWVFTKNLIK